MEGASSFLILADNTKTISPTFRGLLNSFFYLLAQFHVVSRLPGSILINFFQMLKVAIQFKFFRLEGFFFRLLGWNAIFLVVCKLRLSKEILGLFIYLFFLREDFTRTKSIKRIQLNKNKEDNILYVHKNIAKKNK